MFMVGKLMVHSSWKKVHGQWRVIMALFGDTSNIRGYGNFSGDTVLSPRRGRFLTIFFYKKL